MLRNNRLVALLATIFYGSLSCFVAGQDDPFAVYSSNSYNLNLKPGELVRIRLPNPYDHIHVGDPNVADVYVYDSHNFHIVGKSEGFTSITAEQNGELVLSRDIAVRKDTNSVVVSSQLARLRIVARQEGKKWIVIAQKFRCPEGGAQLCILENPSAPDEGEPGKADADD